MFNHFNKTKIIIMLLISLIGFTTGINYQKIVSSDALVIAKGAFEFGFMAFFKEENFGVIFISILISSLKNFIIMLIGALSWTTFLFVPLNLFGLSFKMGLCVSYIFTILSYKGIAESIYAFLICFSCIIVYSLVSIKILDLRIYHTKFKKINSYDIDFFKASLVLFCVHIFFLFIMFVLLKLLNGRLYGLLNSIL